MGEICVDNNNLIDLIMNNTNKEKTYNWESKKEYLKYMIENNNLTPATGRTYSFCFVKTSEFEKKLEKDLGLFTFAELETILYSLKASNRNTIELYARIISSYLNWAVEEKKIDENAFKQLGAKDFSKYLTNEEVYFSEKQLTRYENFCKNAQDSALMRLLFIGVSGKHLSEIRNLKVSDIDYKNKIIWVKNATEEDKDGFPTESTERHVEVDDRTLDLLYEASIQTFYFKKNGEVKQTERKNISTTTSLVENDYIFRPSMTNSKKTDKPVGELILYRRLKMMGDYFGFAKSLTTKFVERCGMIHFANNLLEGEGHSDNLPSNILKSTAKAFNIANTHNLRGFLTIENIRKTYPKK